MGRKRLIEKKIVDDEKIGYTRICMWRAFWGRLPGSDSRGRSKPTTETARTGEEDKPATETANTGLPGSKINRSPGFETNPRDCQEKRKPTTERVNTWAKLAKVIEEIQALVQQEKLTWEEVYLLFEKIFNTLEAKLETTREEAISGFQQSLGALRKEISKISTNFSREVLSKITNSRIFKRSIMKLAESATALVLVVSPITTPSTLAKDYYNYYTAYGPAYTTPKSGFDDRFSINQTGVISSSSFTDTGSVEQYDPGEGPKNGEGEEFIEQALNSLEEYPIILNNTLLQIIDKINQQLLQEKDKQPPITGFKIVKDESPIVELSGSTHFSEGVYKFNPEEGTLELYAQTENGEYEISDTGGVIVVDHPYVLNGEGGVKQYTSGVFILEGHCCGQTPDFSVFKRLGDSEGGIVEINVGGEVYKFTIEAVGELDAQASVDILSFDYQKIEEYLAKLLGLYDGTNPQWKEELSPENSEKLNELMEAFLADRLIFLITCDENNLRVVNGQLQSTGRVVAVATLQPGQDPSGFIKPAFVVPVEGAIISIKSEEDRKIIKKLLENLHQKYPEIVEESLRESIAEVQKLEDQQNSNPGTDTDSNPAPQPQIGSNSPSAVNQPNPDSVQPDPPSQIKELPTEAKLAQEINYLNEELSKAGLNEFLPPIEFVGNTGAFNLQGLVYEIDHSDKDLFSFIRHFSPNQHHLELLRDYIQVLEQLAVEAPDGDYKQDLNDFANKLRLVELIASWSLPAGGITITGSIILPLLFFLRRQKQKSS